MSSSKTLLAAMAVVIGVTCVSQALAAADRSLESYFVDLSELGLRIP
jgi:hypothetical protein